MEEQRKRYPNDPHAEYLKDCFGRAQSLQLGIPSGENSHRLFNVSPSLAESVIKAHIADKRAELVEVNEDARIEMGLPSHSSGIEKDRAAPAFMDGRL